MLSIVTSLFTALTTPVVTDCPYPKAFPIAIIPFPTFNAELSPRVAILIDSIVALSRSLSFTAITATSLLSDVLLLPQ